MKNSFNQEDDQEYQRKLVVQSVIDRICEFGPDYIQKLHQLNQNFKPEKHKILIPNQYAHV